MGKIKTIGVLTGGGDCPGLNPAIKAITNKAHDHNIRVIGIRQGWHGMMSCSPELQGELDAAMVRHIDRQGGTMLGTTRTNPFSIAEGPQKVIDTWKKLELDALIAIGGEDTLGVAWRLHRDHDLSVVGVPKTIDRDLGQTQYTLGFESALQVITDSVDKLRSTAESHSRIFVVEVMGRHAGHLALRGQISSGASMTLIPEHPFDLAQVTQLLKKHWEAGQRYSIVLVAEGAVPLTGTNITQNQQTDAFGHIRLGGIGNWLAEQIDESLSLEARCVNLSHLQRGGSPVAYDRRLGFYFGTAAVEAILLGTHGKMVALQQGCISLVDMKKAVEKLEVLDTEKYYDSHNYRAKREILGVVGKLEM